MNDLLKYAKLSEATYSAKINIGRDSEEIAGVATQTPEGLIVGFQGTDNVDGIVSDIAAVPHGAGPLGRVHHGILESVRSIWPELSALSPVVVYGHSLGGAQALVYAALLCVEGRPPKEVYAFEPPKISIDDKIGNLLLANGVNVIITHNGNDLVPMLPFGLVWSWRHPAPLLRIWPATTKLPNLRDHLINKVIKNIRSYVKG